MSLEPVRAALLARARAEAGSRLEAARREADERLAAAHAEAAELLRLTAAEREEAAGAARVRRTVAARRQAHGVVLRARREACDELRAAARAAVAELRAGPGYPALLARLTEAARRQLGPGAEVEEPAAGGVVARAGERLVDYSLPAMVDRALAGPGAGLEELWA